MDGGEGDDFLFGGGGDDSLVGGGGEDLLVGNDDLHPDRFETVVRGGATGRNDDLTFAALLPPLDLSPQQPVVIKDLNFHQGDSSDWYVIPTPTALNRFGQSQRAFLSSDLISANVVGTGTPLDITLIAAEDIDPTAELNVVPSAEQDGGVPDYYLLRVANATTAALEYQLTFSADIGRSIHVAADDAAYDVSLTDTRYVPAAIPLGDINGDLLPATGRPDMIVGLRDNPGEIIDSFTALATPGLHPADVTKPSFAQVAFGNGTFQDQSFGPGGLTLRLPAPVQSPSLWARNPCSPRRVITTATAWTTSRSRCRSSAVPSSTPVGILTRPASTFCTGAPVGRQRSTLSRRPIW